MIIYYLKMTALATPFVLLYNILEHYLSCSWLPAAIVISLMIAMRIVLYLYRRSKGIKDTWPND